MSRPILIAILALAGSAIAPQSASAQPYRRGPFGRVVNSLPIPPWMTYYALRRPNVVVVQPTPSAGTTLGTTTGSSAMPERQVDIKVVLPVAGATIAVNGVDFGKTEYFERKLSINEPASEHDLKVVATWTANGKEVTQTRNVTINKSGKATANFFVDDKK